MPVLKPTVKINTTQLQVAKIKRTDELKATPRVSDAIKVQNIRIL
jgi:hypothetical protein